MSIKRNNLKQFGLVTLIIATLCTVTTKTMASNTFAESVSTLKDLVSYSDILLYIACMLIVVPFAYIGYLRIHIVPEEHLPFHFGGEYAAKDIIKHVEGLETTFAKKFPKFKRLVELFDKDTEGDLRKHSEIINSVLLCIKFNGRRRLVVFWNSSDIMLKFIIFLLPLVIATIVFTSNIYYGLGGLIMSLVPMVFIVPLILTIFSNFLRISQNIHRRRGNPIPALSLASLALEALINFNIARSFDNETGDHYYYTIIHKYNNDVNGKFGFSNVHVKTSSEIYGSMKELAIGKNKNTH